MNYREECVKEFHDAFGVDVGTKANFDLISLRIKLIDEESRELLDALYYIKAALECKVEPIKERWIEVMDGMADLQVVLSGTAVAVKELRNFDEAFKRVHASNMSKLGADGKPIYREDGKVLKGPNFVKPYLEDLVP